MAPQNQKKVDDTAYVPPPGTDQVRGQGRGAVNDQDLLDKMLAGNVGGAAPAPPAPVPSRPVRAKETKAVASTPARAAAPAEAAALEVEPARPVATRQPITPIVRSSGLIWGQQFLSEFGAFLVLGISPYLFDMLFTTLGLTRALIPATAVGYGSACLLHIGMSFGQRHFLFQRGPIRWAGALLLGVNGQTNVYGVLPIIDQTFGDEVLSAVPRDPARWPEALLWSNLGQLWKSFWNDTLSTWAWQWPSWSIAALTCLVGCIALAWLAEYWLIYFWRRVAIMWQHRPA